MALKRFREADVNLVSLCTYSTMLEAAEEINYISPSAAEALREWRKDPADWTPESII